MNFFKVGVVDFFGILCPGVILVLNIAVIMHNIKLATYWWIPIQESDHNIFSDFDGALIFFFAFVVAYLFGFALRLLSPDLVDEHATWFAFRVNKKQRLERNRYKNMYNKRMNINENYRKLSRKEKELKFRRYIKKTCIRMSENNFPRDFLRFYWLQESYPYYAGTKYVYYKHFGAEIANIIMKDFRHHNKDTYNYWKTFLASSDGNLSTIVFQAEAFVRFMSGSFWAITVGIFAGLSFVPHGLWEIFSGKVALGVSEAALGLLFATMSMVLLALLLLRFKNQRRREVKTLLDALLALYVNGTHPNCKTTSVL